MTKKELRNINNIIKRALKEDIGDGDITTLSAVPKRFALTGAIIAKESGIIAGLEVAEQTFKVLDKRMIFSPHVTDGKEVAKGSIIATVQGNGRALLTAERTALNFLQRMSGIATLTHAFVKASNTASSTKVIIVDTRKTAPGIRILDKWAVRLGGGQNHRFGLFDMALIKENHVAAAGGITEAVKRVRKKDKRNRQIEVEVRNLDELREALKLRVDRILLDNMSLEQMRQAVRLTSGRTQLEASGNISLENVADVAGTGVNIISIGKLTHSVKAFDISFLIEPIKK